MALDSATHDFVDASGKVLAHMELEVIDRPGRSPLLRWRMTDENGHQLDADVDRQVPRPFRGEIDADQALMYVTAELAGRIKTTSYGNAPGQESPAAKWFRKRREDMDPKFWEQLDATVRLLERLQQRYERIQPRDHKDDPDKRFLSRSLGR